MATRGTSKVSVPERWSRAELYAAGKALRDKTPRRSHAESKPRATRVDPIEILIDSSRGRVARLVPIRYGRMLLSPFTFYRGAAAPRSRTEAGRRPAPRLTRAAAL